MKICCIVLKYVMTSKGVIGIHYAGSGVGYVIFSCRSLKIATSLEPNSEVVSKFPGRMECSTPILR